MPQQYAGVFDQRTVPVEISGSGTFELIKPNANRVAFSIGVEPTDFTDAYAHPTGLDLYRVFMSNTIVPPVWLYKDVPTLVTGGWSWTDPSFGGYNVLVLEIVRRI